MKMGKRHLKALVFAVLLAASASWLVDCGNKNNPNQAPTCPTGQFLVYSSYQGGYSCQYGTVSSTGFGYNNYQQPYTGYAQPGVMTNLVAPIQACPAANQVLLNWNQQGWFCYYTDIIYPGGSSSPQGYAPPPGRGGEYCIPGYGSAYSGYGTTTVINPTGLNCPPPFTCHSQTGVVTPGYNGGSLGLCG